MRNENITDLTECREIRQIVAARPPRIVRGTLLILTGLLATATGWSATSKVDLIVKAPGRVRPMTSPRNVVSEPTGENLISSVGGRVTEVTFRLGDEVRKGQTLFRLDTARLDNDIAKKRAVLGSLGEEIRRLEKLLALLAEERKVALAKHETERKQAERRREAEVREARLKLARARREEERRRRLVAEDLVARAELEKATAEREEAEARLRTLEVHSPEIETRKRELLEKEYARRIEELRSRREAKGADRTSVEKELANLSLDRERSVVRAHVDGVITAGELNVGDVIEAGKAVMAIAQQRGFRIDVAVPSGEVGGLREGMPARVKLDAYDYQKYGAARGKIVSISPDSQVQDGKVFYVVKVALAETELARGDRRGPIKLGMTGQVEILTGNETILSVFLKKIDRAMSLS